MSAYITVTDAAGRVVARRIASAREAGAARACAPLASAAQRPQPESRAWSSRDGGAFAEISAAAYAAYRAACAAASVGGERRAVDAARGLRAVYDAGGTLREVSAPSREGIFVRVNFPARD